MRKIGALQVKKAECEAKDALAEAEEGETLPEMSKAMQKILDEEKGLMDKLEEELATPSTSTGQAFVVFGGATPAAPRLSLSPSLGFERAHTLAC
eukprot:3905050-Prymnesium_polylepis.2